MRIHLRGFLVLVVLTLAVCCLIPKRAEGAETSRHPAATVGMAVAPIVDVSMKAAARGLVRVPTLFMASDLASIPDYLACVNACEARFKCCLEQCAVLCLIVL